MTWRYTRTVSICSPVDIPIANGSHLEVESILEWRNEKREWQRRASYAGVEGVYSARNRKSSQSSLEAGQNLLNIWSYGEYPQLMQGVVIKLPEVLGDKVSNCVNLFWLTGLAREQFYANEAKTN